MECETITISLEHYNELIEDQKLLFALQRAEVDNWSGYDFALEIMEEMENAS